MSGSLLIALASLASTLMTADDSEIRWIAHRGGVVDDQRIENNLPAIEEAVRRGYWMVEVDVQESSDGELVVHHDATFQRFYGDRQLLKEMAWSEIEQLRSTPGGLKPLTFAEYAAACKDKLRVMLDVKGSHPPEFFDRMEKILRDNELLSSAYFIGTSEAKAHFKGKAPRVSVNSKELEAAEKKGEPVSDLYFLFEHGRDLDEAAVRRAQELGVPVVPSVNIFHYASRDHLEKAKADMDRLRKLGVMEFQIDSVYDDAFQEGAGK